MLSGGGFCGVDLVLLLGSGFVARLMEGDVKKQQG